MLGPLLPLLLAAPLAAAGFDADTAAVVREARRASESRVVSVLTYNVYGVTPWNTDEPEQDAESLTHYRTIGEEFARLRGVGHAPQVVVLQEMFHPLADAVFTLSGYPYIQKGAGARLPRKPGRSGLVMMSEYPLSDVQTEDYAVCTGWDCFANKGMLVARVNVPGVPGGIQLYTTHMNADDSGASLPESKAARLVQARQLTAFVARTRIPGIPAVFAGDFNFRSPDEDYALVAAMPGFRNAGKDLAPDVWKTAIDHQFYSAGSGSIQALSFEETFRDVGGKPPSDHLGVEVHYSIKP